MLTPGNFIKLYTAFLNSSTIAFSLCVLFKSVLIYRIYQIIWSITCRSGKSIINVIQSFIFNSNVIGCCTQGILANVLDGEIVVNKFEFHSCYYILFCNNALLQKFEPLICPELYVIHYLYCSSILWLCNGIINEELYTSQERYK